MAVVPMQADTIEIMGTTSSEAAEACLRALDASGVEFALLHGERRLAHGEVESDLDLVVDRAPMAVIRAALEQLHRADLHPIVAWTYDIGGTATVFLVTSDAREGVQLDLLHDPDGRGRYGVRSMGALGRAVRGEKWPTLTHVDGLVYVARKRQVKAQGERFAAAVQQLNELERDEVDASVASLLSLRAGEDLHRGIEGGTVLSRRGKSAHLSRLLSRVARPIGFWVECANPEVAAEVARRLGRVLPHTGLATRPTGLLATLVWWIGEVAPVRWRPGVFVSIGDGSRHGPVVPDAVCGGIDDPSLQALIGSLEHRVLASR
jgi:predicted nucleotidyltransferase